VLAIRCLALLLTTIASSAAGQTIQLEDGVFKVSNWRADSFVKDWAPIFSVYAGAGDMPAMLGTYSVENGILKFRPRFPLSPGVQYRAVFRPPSAPIVTAVFNLPTQSADSATRVDHVYPSASVLPSNVLKLYIVFSAPMSRGDAWKRIHLLGSDGRPVKNAFLELDQELWDPGMRRLTVLFDPGRVKRDLTPNLQIGLPVVEGREYALVIDREFADARGLPLAEGVRKSFRGAAADRTPLDPANWKIVAPNSGTRDPLAVTFPKPLDYALLQRTIEVLREVLGAASPIRGTISLAHDETEWDFTPATPWSAGAYRLSISTTLEDLCGNRIARLFDRNEGDRERAPQGKVFRSFEIR
jgi:hypothetical protein